MTRRATSALLALVAAILLVPAIGSPLAAAAPQNLWLGVVQPDFTVEPVAALVDGKWRYDTEEDTSQREAMTRTIGAVPAQWLPPGQPLPTTWHAHLFNGHTITLHTAGPLHLTGDPDHLAVRSDRSTPDPGAIDPEMPNRGVALVGDAALHVFTKLPAGKRREILHVIDRDVLKAERSAFAHFTSESHADAASIAAVTDRMIADAPLEVERAESSLEHDGSIVYYIEGRKQYRTQMECQPQTRVSAAIRQDPSGGFHPIEVSAVPTCDLYISNAPLAILERGGAACWLVTRRSEDAVEYVLMKPGHVSALDPGPSDCALK